MDRTQACCLGAERGRWEDPRTESRPPSARPAATSPSTREPPGPSESSPAPPGPWAGAELPVHRLTAGFSLSPHKLPSRWYPDSQASAEDGAAVLLRVAEINSHHLSLTAASAPFSKCCGKGSLWLLWPCLSPPPGWGPAVLTAGPQQQCRLPSPPHTGSPHPVAVLGKSLARDASYSLGN